MHNNPEEIKVIEPRPYQKVGARFSISGWIPESWLDNGSGMDYRISLEFVDINCQIFIGTSLDVILSESNVIDGIRYLKFCGKREFDYFNGSFIIGSQGRIGLRFSCHKQGMNKYVPIVVRVAKRFFFPNIFKIIKHGRIGKIIDKYESDLKKYYSSLADLEEKRKEKNFIDKDDEKRYMPISFIHITENMDIIGGLLNLLDKFSGINKNYPLAKEDKEEERLERKYKNAIRWRGPLCGGIFGRMNGLTFNIYNNDHDKHFHVIHKGRGINARFSFPELELINYKSAKNSISSKEMKKIIEFVKRPEIFKKLEEEFQKREEAEKNRVVA